MTKSPEKKENLLLNFLLNIIIPTLILTKLSGDEYLGAKLGVIVALSFPVCYGIYDFTRVGKVNFISALGVISVLLTGGISLLELDPLYIAIKEAAIPAFFAVAALVSLKTRYPLVKTLLYNDKVLQIDVVDAALEKHNNTEAFRRTLVNATYIIAGSFVVSSILNFVLARWIMVSPPGTEAFNEELGRMTFLSYFVIMVPSMIILMSAMFYLFRNIKQLTQLPLEKILHDAEH